MKVVIRQYTTRELKAIDKDLGDTGASQRPGWYWQEDEDTGELETGPCGPYKTAQAAARNYGKTYK